MDRKLPADAHERCFRHLCRNLLHANYRDVDGTFNDKETREMLQYSWKVYINCPRPSGWTPEFNRWPDKVK